MALGKRLTEVLLVIKANQPISIPEIVLVLKEDGKKGGLKSVTKSVDRLGKRGFVAGDIGISIVRLPKAMMKTVAKESSYETDLSADYWGWTVDHTDEEVADQFEQAFGRAPDSVIRSGGCVLAGPIGKGEKPA